MANVQTTQCKQDGGFIDKKFYSSTLNFLVKTTKEFTCPEIQQGFFPLCFGQHKHKCVFFIHILCVCHKRK